MKYALLILLFFAFSIGIFFVPIWWVLASVFVWQVVFILVFKLNLMKALRGLLVFLPFAVLIFLFLWWAGDSGTWELGREPPIDPAIEGALMTTAQMFLVVLGTFIFTSTVTIVNFVFGLTKLLTPFRWVGLNARDIAVTIAIAVSFIPILLDEYTKISQALNAKGKRRGLKLATQVIIYKVLFRAGSLSETLDAKGYGN